MLSALALFLASIGAGIEEPASREVTSVGNGIWKIRFGTPEEFTPCAFRKREPDLEGLKRLPGAPNPPFDLAAISCEIRPSRTIVKIPCDDKGVPIYGFGLDPGAFNQRGLRKWLSVSASVVGKTGASHGPVPFYVSAEGYGLYVDTARVPFVHVARLSSKGAIPETHGESGKTLATSETDLYAARKAEGLQHVVFDLAGNGSGVDVFVFAGPTPREAVQRFNLFSGGGCVPPMWGLGQKYRTHSNAVQDEALRLAKSIRDMNVPCDMFGFEPGWQTHAYSCSLVWSRERFPNHRTMLDQLRDMGFRPNLWEHAYIHPTSPLFEPLHDKSGDYLVWQGLVVDFADSEASRVFADYHEKSLVNEGISGFKADECDRQFIDDVTPFNYPECSKFPSGIDGDQMTQMYGYLYQRSLLSVFRKNDARTWGDVRATSALAAPLPFCLYSDAYKFDEYLRQLVNASFTGLLWSPEVREAHSREELLNRVAMSGLAPQMCLNIWFMPHPVWQQYERVKNEKNELLPPDEQKSLADRIRDIVNLRMALLPYLYASFFRYREEGLPPVRALALEFPDDPGVSEIDTQYIFGDLLMAAPFIASESKREVYFPQGCDWIDFRTNERHAGGTRAVITAPAGDAPLFVRDNSLLPLATPVQHVARDTVFDMSVRVYGQAPKPFTLCEDDGESFAYERGKLNKIALTWNGRDGEATRSGNYPGTRYRISAWNKISDKK